MLAAYDGSLPHPRSKSAFQNDRGQFVCIDAEGAVPKPTDCLYHFNSFGYRGEEFDPAARLKIFVSGCSYTFGLGVERDQTWPALLKKQLSAKLDVPFDRTNLQNFSQIGASNGYIARTIIRQCDRARPDLAVIAFTHRERTEYLAPGVTRESGALGPRPSRGLGGPRDTLFQPVQHQVRLPGPAQEHAAGAMGDGSSGESRT